MPRYKDSPEVRAAKKERKEKLREFLSLLDVEDMSDLRSVFKEMVGEVLENGLEAELDDELGYSRYDYRNKETENSRNGHSRKTMKTSAGDLEIADPRLSRPITILYFMPFSVFTQIMKKSLNCGNYDCYTTRSCQQENDWNSRFILLYFGCYLLSSGVYFRAF